jgi:DNA helicase TIP49 (TBP-interacting protein)
VLKRSEVRVRLTESDMKFLEELGKRRSLRTQTELLRYCIAAAKRCEGKKRRYQDRKRRAQAAAGTATG